MSPGVQRQSHSNGDDTTYYQDQHDHAAQQAVPLLEIALCLHQLCGSRHDRLPGPANLHMHAAKFTHTPHPLPYRGSQPSCRAQSEIPICSAGH